MDNSVPYDKSDQLDFPSHTECRKGSWREHGDVLVKVSPSHPTARAEVPREVKERSLTCSVCLELFSEPKVLPCCHTFCLKCLEKTACRDQKSSDNIARVQNTAGDGDDKPMACVKEAARTQKSTVWMEQTAHSEYKRGNKPLAKVKDTARSAQKSVGWVQKTAKREQKSAGNPRVWAKRTAHHEQERGDTLAAAVMKYTAHSEQMRYEIACMEKAATPLSMSMMEQRGKKKGISYQDPRAKVNVGALSGVAGHETKEKEITCPQCRKTHVIPAGGLTEFLTDFIALYEIEVADLQSSKGDKTRVCGECEGDGPLESYCNDCQNYLCHDCGSQLHKRLKAYRGHTVVLIKDIDVATFQPCQVRYCASHKGEVLKLYCKTCKKLICRDCTLVDHHQHKYAFVKDARQQVNAKMQSLKHNVNQKLDKFKHNLQQIKQVETAATGHSEVVKANVNTFFDKLVQSMEARRTLLLRQVENRCQKDMKQIWADKEFHETFISQFSSVFSLADKACKCSSDVEMILTALQSIEQLTQLQNRDWDNLAFVNVVSSTPKFSKGGKVAVDKVGLVDSSSSSSVVIELSYAHRQASLGTSVTFNVHVTSPLTQELVDKRSGKPVDLQGDIPQDLRAIVHYGNSEKELNTAHISLVKVPKAHGSYGARSNTYPYYAERVESAPVTVEESYNVTIQLVCGGDHTVTFTAGGSEKKHTLTVDGFPPRGVQVKKGPDWKSRQRYLPSPLFTVHDTRSELPGPYNQSSGDEIGTVVDVQQALACYVQQELACDVQGGWGYGMEDELDYSGDIEIGRGVVIVRERSGDIQYKWGQDGSYEVELVNVNTMQQSAVRW